MSAGYAWPSPGRSPTRTWVWPVTTLRSAPSSCCGRSEYVRAAERGRPQPLAALECANRAVLDAIVDAADETPRDWERFTRQAVQFHLRNAIAWANAKVGEDLAEQVDPEFRLGP